jgi:hypothetical protein
MKGANQDKLAKVLALLTSSMDGEVVAAARAAVRILAAAGRRPGDLVNRIHTLNEPLTDNPRSPQPPATPPEPQARTARPKAEEKRSFADLYPSEARRVLADLLTYGLSPRDEAFVRGIAERLYSRPHEGLKGGEKRRLTALWNRISPQTEAA